MLYEKSWENSQQKTHLEHLLTKDEAWKINNQLNSIIDPYLEENPFSQVLSITTSTTIKDLKSDIDMYPLDYYDENLSLAKTNDEIKEEIFLNVWDIASKNAQVCIDSKILLKKLKTNV